MASNKEIPQLEQNMEKKIRELASGERSSEQIGQLIDLFNRRWMS
jgi:hypothetical protein